MAEKFVPITDLPSLQDDPESFVTWDFDVPPTLEAERIELNVVALQRIQRIAGFRASQIVSYQGDTTTYTPTITGIHNDGTAQAGMTGQLSPAKKSDTGLRDDLLPSFQSLMDAGYFKTTTLNRLNRAEIAQKVADGRDSNKSREQRWALAIDDALKHSLGAGAKAHLIGRRTTTNAISMGGSLGLDAGMALNLWAQDIKGVGFDAAIIGAVLGIHAAVSKMIFGDSLMREKRWSLFWTGGLQPDRYLAARGVIAASRLIRARR